MANTAVATGASTRPNYGSMSRDRTWALRWSYFFLVLFAIFFLMPPRARKNGHPLCAKGSPSNSVMGATIFVADVLDSATGVCLFNEGSGIGV